MNPHPIPASKPYALTVWRSLFPALLVFALSGLCSRTFAQGFQTDTWTGGGTDKIWTDSTNWNQAVTTFGDDLVFTGTTDLTPSNNFVGLNVDSITINSPGFAISGNALTITNGFTDTVGTSNSISIPMTLGASQTFQNQGGGTTDTVSGTIALATHNLTVGGSGDMFFTAAISSTSGGTITVNNGGVAKFSATAAYGTNVPDAVIVSAGTFQYGSAAAIPSAAGAGNVNVNGTLDLNGFSPIINGLEGAGTVDNVNSALTGTYTLTLGTANSNAVWSGSIKNSSGTVAVFKTGYGTETFAANNLYDGLTTINQGTLAVASGGSLGLTSPSLVISPGAVLDVSALNPIGYTPQAALNLNAGTPNKPYTNFLGSYDTNYPNFVITTNVVNSTNVYSTNTIISVINYDVNGDFNLFGGSFTPVAPAPGFATFTINGNLNLDNSLGVGANNLNFLLNNVTTVGGGVNDLIVVTNGTLNIGDNVNIIVQPAAGSLATGKYTLIVSSNYVSGGDFNGSGPANYTVIAPRGISGTVDTTSQPGNVLLSASGTSTPGNITWAGTPTSENWDLHVSQNWKNGASPDYFYSQDNVTFNDSGVGTVNLPGPVSPGSVTFNNNVTNYNFVAGGGAFITGTSGLTLNGTGTVSLANPNSFTGNTVINNGVLALYPWGGYGSQSLYTGVAPGQVVFGGVANSVLELNDTVANTLPFVALSGFTLNSGANAQIATLSNRGGTRGANDVAYMSIGTNIVRNVGSSLYINFLLRGNTTYNGIYFSNSIPWTNGLMLGGWAHVGTDWLAAMTNYGGAYTTFAYAGYSNNTAIANWVATNNISLSNSTVSVTGSSNIYTLRLVGPTTTTISSGQTLTILSGGLLESSAATGPNVMLGGTVKGAPGQDLIVLQNSTTQPFTIGSVIADNGSATALTLGGLGGTLILTNNNTYSGATYINAGTLQVGAGAALGSIASSSSILDNGALAFNRPDATSVGLVSGSGGITQAGTGTLTLTANNTMKGAVLINSGTLQLGNGGTSGSISNASSVVDSGTLVVDNSSTVSYPNTISGVGRLVQFGSGTLVIPTNETYSGSTTVSNGSVVLTASGSLPNTAAIQVNSGAIFDASAIGGLSLRSTAPVESLAGAGTVNGSVTTASGTSVYPGGTNAIGTLTVNGNLNFNAGNYVFDLSNTSNDMISASGTLNQGGGVIIMNVLGSPLANGLYKLVSATGGLTGSVANLALANFIQPGQIAYLTNSTANELDVVVISGTEPTLTWQGDGSQNLWDTTSSSKWLNGLTPTIYTNGDLVVFNDSGSASPNVNLDATVYPTSVTVTNNSNNYTFGITGGSGANRISGGASLTKSGTAALTLQTVNDYIGGTTINGGTVQLNGDGGANDDGMIGTGPVLNNGVLIANNANLETIAGNLSGSGLLVQQGVGPLVLAGNNTGDTGPVSIPNATGLLEVGNGIQGTLTSGNVTNNGNILFNPGAPISTTANISGTGTITNISGTVTLNGNDTYSGATIVNTGTLRLGSATAFPAGTTLTLNDGTNVAGVFDLNGQSISITNLVGANPANATAGFAASQIVNDGTGTSIITLSGPVTNTFAGQIVDNNNSGTGKVGLFIHDGPVFTLNAGYNAASVITVNTFSGGVTVSNAQLSLYGNVVSSTPTAVGTDVAGTGAYTLAGTNDLLFAGGSGGSTTPTINTTIGALTVPAGTTAWIYGPQRGTFAAASLSGSGSVIYQPNYVRNQCNLPGSAFTGTITFEQIFSTSGANLPLNSAQGFPLANVILGITNRSTVDLCGTVSGNALQFGSLSGGDNTMVLGGGTTPGSEGSAPTIYTIGGLGSNNMVGCQFVDAGCGIRKVGTGTLTLTNTVLSYGSQTVVSNGTLSFVPLVPSGSLTATADGAGYLVSSNYTIVSPGILDLSSAGGTLYLGHVSPQTLFGNGTLNAALDLTNGLVEPALRASDAGFFSGSALTINGAYTMRTLATNVITINRTNATPNDSITATSIALGGTLIVTNLGDTNYPAYTTNTFHLFNGSVSGNFASVTLPVLAAGQYWITNLTVNGSIAIANTNSAIASNPTNILFSVSGNTLSLVWPGDHLGWYLQAQTNALSVGISNNWVDVAGSSAVTNENITLDPTKPAVFYRLSKTP